jgi:hypothetical protein
MGVESSLSIQHSTSWMYLDRGSLDENRAVQWMGGRVLTGRGLAGHWQSSCADNWSDVAMLRRRNAAEPFDRSAALPIAYFSALCEAEL